MQSDLVTAEERTWLLEHLQTVHAAINDVVRQIPPEIWVRSDVAQNWSPAEVVEHTLLVDEEILADVRGHLQDQPFPDWERVTARKDAVLKHYLPNIGRARANARTSTFRGFLQQDVPAALAKSYQSVEGILFQESGTALKTIVWLHGGMGPLNAYQWLLYIPLHAERHLNQLLRVMQIADQVEWADPKHRWESIRV
jgi:hypothetical protein